MDFLEEGPVQLNRISLKLTPVFIGQLFIVESLNFSAFHYSDGLFQVALQPNEGITPQFISEYAKKFSSEIFIYREDLTYINSKLKEELTKLTRSLSIGDVKKNAIKHSHFLSMQMNSLYRDPFNDELLSVHFQSSKSLGSLLIKNKAIHKSVFQNIQKSNYHYTYTQPLLSSVLLLSFLQSLNVFNTKEIENLFLASYFKDIGMSFIPREKFEIKNLTDSDKDLFAAHAESSMQILEGRVPLNKTQLNLIRNHHYLNYKIQNLISGVNIPSDDRILTGLESTLLSGLDILTAMTTPRPYREAMSPFKVLELLKKVMADEYPQEFKLLVPFLRTFFK